MERYIGLDAHMKSCTFVVTSETGKIVLTQRVETNGEALCSFLRGISGRKHLCMEEGELSEWLYEILGPFVSEIKVIQPKKQQGIKSDAKDAAGLAEIIRTGAKSTVVFKSPGTFCGLREAVRAQLLLTRKVAGTKNQIKALYRSRGIQVAGRQVFHCVGRQEYLPQLPVAQRRFVELLYQELDTRQMVSDQASTWLSEESAKHQIVRLLTSAPGIGPVRAAQIVATVITPNRFRTKRQFWSYCGFGLRTHASAEWEQRPMEGWVRDKKPQARGLNRKRNPLMKNVFKGAAMSVVCRPGHVVYPVYGRQLQQGIKPPSARLTLSRQIAAVVLRMWKNKEAFNEELFLRSHQT